MYWKLVDYMVQQAWQLGIPMSRKQALNMLVKSKVLKSNGMPTKLAYEKGLVKRT